jgi:hypothetical protein
MKTVLRRVGRLEDRFGPGKPRKVLQIVVSRIGAGEAGLEKATCTRHWAGDLPMEVIKLNRWNNPYTREELDRFVERFPITRGPS